jgi:hypothetical protein
VRQLFRVVDWLLDLPWELQQGFQDELHSWEQENAMRYVTSVERFGIEMGLKEGLQEGISALLETKFGPAGKRLMSRVRKIGEVDELRAVLKAIPAAESLQAIRDRLASR